MVKMDNNIWINKQKSIFNLWHFNISGNLSLMSWCHGSIVLSHIRNHIHRLMCHLFNIYTIKCDTLHFLFNISLNLKWHVNAHTLGWKHTRPPKNCSHTYNLSTINFFGNVWTSHLGLFLFVLSIFD